MVFGRFNILSLLIAVAANLVFSESAICQEVPVQLEQALSSGSARQFSAMFDERVQIAFDDQSSDYSRIQAQVVLTEFLSELDEVHYETIHQESSKSQSTYYIGKMTTSDSTYRVYVNVKRIGGEDLVQAIKFEKQ
jgi:isocitrate dehydrogenase kinase/phosphatase